MSRQILLLTESGNPWIDFLKECFEDTTAQIHLFHDAAAAGALFSKPQQLPDLIFSVPALLSPVLTQKIKAYKSSRPDARLFGLGIKSKSESLAWDEVFEAPESLSLFQKKMVQHLPLPEKIQVLIVDDEQEIGVMVKDFLEARVAPAFEVDYAENGEEGLKAAAKKKYDAVILDVKMPVKDGREVYRELTKRNYPAAIIVFFDAISGDEVTDIHKIGRPAIVEKGGRESAMPEMITLIKKLVYLK